MTDRKKRAFRRNRLLVLFILNGALFLVAALYALAFLYCENRGIDLFRCRFARVTGIYCPGCGGSRAVVSLLRFDVVRAAVYYPPIIVALLLIADLDVRLAIDAVRGEDLAAKKFRALSFLLIPIAMLVTFAVRAVLLLAFGVDVLGDLTSLLLWCRC